MWFALYVSLALLVPSIGILWLATLFLSYGRQTERRDLGGGLLPLSGRWLCYFGAGILGLVGLAPLLVGAITWWLRF